ncbi:MAG: histidine phosphatase family protein [Defluviitaleaceae bacterium]|nr:histidine phosphatase family protein [Defluviitaleaceae bacterium]MCL2264091.1 histidine phosphatase family protein [Defluviitaleaceae bacterium]
MYLYIIRHGEPDYATDSLTDLGKKQAAALAERLCVHGFDEIYTSPLGRAIQTAQPTCERLGISHKIEEWMSEDLTFDDLSAECENGKRDWSFACQSTKLLDHAGEWHGNPVFSTCRAAQDGYARITKCSDDFLARLGYTRNGKTYKITAPSEKRIAAFCHHGLGTSWLSHLLSIPPNIFWASFNIAHSSVTVLEFNNNKDGFTAPQCVCLSDVSHIYKGGLAVNSSVFG